MPFLRSIIVFVGAAAFLVGCEGTQTGRTLFGTPSNNQIASIQLILNQKPNRSSTSDQFLPLQVNAYDKWGNLINSPYNERITLSSNGDCEIGFDFYTPNSTSTPPPYNVSVDFDSPEEIGVGFDPTCGPDPVTITASAAGVPNATVTF